MQAEISAGVMLVTAAERNKRYNVYVYSGRKRVITTRHMVSSGYPWHIMAPERRLPMRYTKHSKFFNFVYITALLLILAVFGAVGYFLVTSQSFVSEGQFQATSAVILVGGVVGLLALLTATFYVLSRLDSREEGYYGEESEPANYGAPRS